MSIFSKDQIYKVYEYKHFLLYQNNRLVREFNNIFEIAKYLKKSTGFVNYHIFKEDEFKINEIENLKIIHNKNIYRMDNIFFEKIKDLLIHYNLKRKDIEIYNAVQQNNKDESANCL